VCNFWDSPFYSRHKFFFELTGFNVFMIFFWNIFCVLVQEKCLQTRLHPKSGKELKNL